MRGSSSQGAFMLVAIITLIINSVVSEPNPNAGLKTPQQEKSNANVVLFNSDGAIKLQSNPDS